MNQYAYHPSDWTVQNYDEKLDMLRIHAAHAAHGGDLIGDLQIPVSRIDVWKKNSGNTYQVLIGGRMTGWFSATEADVQTFLRARAALLEIKSQNIGT